MTTEINDKPIQAQQNTNVKSARYTEAELKKLKKTCADFEAIFTYQLLKTMRQSIPENKTAGYGSSGKDTYSMIMDQKLAETISSKGNGLGLQKILYDQFTQTTKQSNPEEVTNKLK